MHNLQGLLSLIPQREQQQVGQIERLDAFESQVALGLPLPLPGLQHPTRQRLQHQLAHYRLRMVM